MIPKKQPKFISTANDANRGETSWYYGECQFRHLPYIHLQRRGEVANISWDIRWLGLPGGDLTERKLSSLGIQLGQLFDRCRTQNSEASYRGDAGYYLSIPYERAAKVAQELYDVFMSALNEAKA